MIINSYTKFREEFANSILETTNFQFIAPDKIQRGGVGSFVTNGYLADMRTRITGTVSNDMDLFLKSVAANELVVQDDFAVLVNEGPLSCTLRSWKVDPDMYPTFAIGSVRAAGSGFGDTGTTIVGFPTPIDLSSGNYSMEITCNSFDPDAGFGVDEYNWYLSRRTEDTTKQFISIAQKAPDSDTYSGTVIITPTALAISFLASVDGPKNTPPVIRRCFKNMHLYVRRLSDGAIQWVDLYRAVQNPIYA